MIDTHTCPVCGKTIDAVFIHEIEYARPPISKNSPKVLHAFTLIVGCQSCNVWTSRYPIKHCQFGVDGRSPQGRSMRAAHQRAAAEWNKMCNELSSKKHLKGVK